LVDRVMVAAIVVTTDGRAEVRASAFELDWMNSLRSPLFEAAECSCSCRSMSPLELDLKTQN
jgi:hypothetical protein